VGGGEGDDPEVEGNRAERDVESIAVMSGDDILRNRFGIEPDAIAAFCRKWRIRELSLFGSALRDDFSSDSDVDLLVVYEDPHRDFGPWLRDLTEMEEELKGLFGREVDLVERIVVERSENYIRRREILRNPVSIYAA
jgi:predicted nucleotidyltransferase